MALEMSTSAGLLGLQLDEYKRLLWMGCPTVLYEALKSIRCYAMLHAVHLVEFFSGTSAVTRAFQGAGYAAVGFEILKDPDWMDIMTNKGMLTALALCVHLVPWV